MNIDAFAIGFDHRDRERLHALWDEAIDNEQWSDGPLTRAFEAAWAELERPAGDLDLELDGRCARRVRVLRAARAHGSLPVEHVHGDAARVASCRREVQFVDCNRDDLCMSFEDFERKAREHKPHAAVLVHIGGHIAFEVEQIAAFCRDEGIVLLEDCAHAHGASWHGQRAGTWGDAGLWSFAATKTISTGEGGMLVSRHPELIEFADRFRNYGKPDYAQPGLNYRLNEFTAALGIVGVERLDEITEWKNTVARERLDPQHPNRVRLPEGMVSGYYKYVVFDRARAFDRQGVRRAMPPRTGPPGRPAEQ